MVPLLASTKSAFFLKYEFPFNPHAPLHTEFVRLARDRKWKAGSKGKILEKAWIECFGPDIPLDLNSNERVRRDQARRNVDGEDFSSVLSGFEKLDLGKTTSKKHIKHREVEPEFAAHYGTDATMEARWQSLCQDCGVDPLPPSITKCKKALKRLNINIFDFLEAKNAGKLPRRFRCREHLAVFMERNPERRYPLQLAKRNKFLSILLIECW